MNYHSLHSNCGNKKFLLITIHTINYSIETGWLGSIETRKVQIALDMLGNDTRSKISSLISNRSKECRKDVRKATTVYSPWAIITQFFLTLHTHWLFIPDRDYLLHWVMEGGGINVIIGERKSALF